MILAAFDYQSNGLIDFVISLIGLLLSFGGAAAISGRMLGSLSQRVEALEKDYQLLATKTDINHLAEKLAKIEGMFELRLRQER